MTSIRTGAAALTVLFAIYAFPASAQVNAQQRAVQSAKLWTFPDANALPDDELGRSAS